MKCAISVVLAVPTLVVGHGFLFDPPSRNVVANQNGVEYCPHCLQGGGPTTVRTRANGQWPTVNVPESHGLCGDPVQGVAVEANWRDEPYLVPTAVQQTYSPGEEAVFRIEVRAHHMGHFEFRICDKVLDGRTLSSRADGQACLNTWVLERAVPESSCMPADSDPDCQPIDSRHPGRWYLPPRQQSTEIYAMRYKIPEELQCSHCTLQWYWATGNSCLYDADYLEHFKFFANEGWPASAWCPFCEHSGPICGPAFGEEFWNCADIAVGSGVPSPVSTQAPGPPPVSTISPPSPTSPLSPAPEETSTKTPTLDGCAVLWAKCGGDGWTGPICCGEGNVCRFQDVWYSQCVPSSGSPSPSSTISTSVAPTPAPSTQCAALWGKCGGAGWEGPMCCNQGSICKYQDEWYSQCVLIPALASVDVAGKHISATLRGRRAARHHTIAMVEMSHEMSQVMLPEEVDDGDHQQLNSEL